MPNHIHGILIINKRAGASAAPTISQVIRSFKSKSTLEYVKYINDNQLDISGKIWQRSFVSRISCGKQGRGFVNNWVKIEFLDGKKAFFADGSLLGWGGIFGGEQ